MPRIRVIIKGQDETQQGSICPSSLGFALYLAWLFATTFGGLNFNPGSSIPRFTELTGHPIPLTLAVTMIVQGIFLLVLGPFARKSMRLIRNRSVLGASIGTMAIGTALVFAFQSTGFPGFAVAIVGAIAAGAGSAMMLMYWGIAFSQMKTLSIAINTTIALALAILIHVGFGKIFPEGAFRWYASLLPLLQIPFALSAKPDVPNGSESAPSPSLPSATLIRFASLFGISMALFGISLGSLGASSVISIHMYSDPISQIVVFIIACICIPGLLCLVLRGKLGEKRWDLLLRPMMTIVAMSVLSASVLSSFIPALALFLLYLSTLYMHGALWMYTVGISHEHCLSPSIIIGVGQGALVLGILGGVWMAFDSSLFAEFPQGISRGITIASFVVGYTLNPRLPVMEKPSPQPNRAGSHASTDAPVDASEEKEPLSDDPASQTPGSPLPEPIGIACGTDDTPSQETIRETRKSALKAEEDIYRKACEAIAERYLLSSRQTEVLYMLARGHNAAYVQEKLCITHSTAKSHIYRIYRKLNIHTQHELLAMVEQELAAPLSEGTDDNEHGGPAPLAKGQQDSAATRMTRGQSARDTEAASRPAQQRPTHLPNESFKS